MKTPPIVLVEWWDTCTTSGWVSEAEANAKCIPLCHTVGFLTRDNGSAVTVAASWSADGVGEVSVIPRGAIAAVYPLRKRKRKEADHETVGTC
jgi:hypothetical protein